MSVDKDFVVKNGIQVNENLLYADSDISKIGIGTTTPSKKLVVIGDEEVSGQLSVGTTIAAERLVTTGVTTSQTGLEVGVGGTTFTSSTFTKKVGINSVVPEYTLDVIGPVSIGQTTGYIYGDLTVTGNIKATSLAGQITAGGTVGFTNVTVDNVLDANNAEVYNLFRLEEVNSDTFRFLTAGNPPGIGFTQNTDNPDIYLIRGQNYQFEIDSGGFPFYIKKQPTADLNNIYQDGVEGNGTQVGILTFKVPYNAPNILYYQATNTAGMGGTIYLNNDGKSIDVGFATVRERLDSRRYADFENIYVSGIGTINNIKSNNYSVSAGIVTVRQDQTAFIGVSTGADRVSVQTTNSTATHQVSFVNNVGLGSNYPLHLIDADATQLTYVPSTNVLSCTRFVGNVSGIATGADNINVDQINDNTDYQIIFSTANASAYQRMYIDTNNTHLTYNPSTETLTVENIIGNLFGIATNANFINVDTDSQNTNHQVLFSDNQGGGFQRPYIDSQSNQLTYNPSTNTFSVSNIIGDLTGDVTGNLAGTATNADFINIDEINSNTKYQLLFSTNQAAGYQRPYIDSDSNQLTYNPSTRTFSVQNVVATTVTGVTFTGTAEQANLINVDETGSNLNYQVLFSSNQAAGYQRPYIDSGSGQFIYNPSTNRLTAGNFTGNGAGLTNLNGGNVTTGVINEARLPNASTTAQGVVQLDNSITSTSQTQAASSKAVSDLKSFTANASNLSAGTVNVARLPDASTSGQGIVQLNNSISGTSQSQAASSKAVGDLKSFSSNASNLSAGTVNVARLPDASTSAQGVVQLSNSITSTSQTQAASSKAVSDLKSFSSNASNLSAGTVNAARLPAATNSTQGAVIPINTYPPTSTSTVQPPSADAFRKLYLSAGNLIPPGSRMVFYQTAAPTGWTKLTVDNNKALRVVNGSGGNTGGNISFTGAFSNRAVVLPQHNHGASSADNTTNHTHGGSAAGANATHSHGGSASGGGHSHSGGGSVYIGVTGNNQASGAGGGNNTYVTGDNKGNTNFSVNVGGGSHSHSVGTNNANAGHSHGLTINAQNANHNHDIFVNSSGFPSASMDFSVQYVDVIICSKD